MKRGFTTRIVNSNINGSIDDMTDEALGESESDLAALLVGLFDHCEQEQFIQRHVWKEGDVVRFYINNEDSSIGNEDHSMIIQHQMMMTFAGNLGQSAYDAQRIIVPEGWPDKARLYDTKSSFSTTRL